MYVQEKVIALQKDRHYILHNDLFITKEGVSDGTLHIAKGNKKLFVGTEEEVAAEISKLGLPSKEAYSELKQKEQ
jgi:hypothetical protein